MQTLPTQFVLILGGILGFMFGASLAVGVGLVLLSTTGLTQEAL